jgi:homoserine acetyltransferase
VNWARPYQEHQRKIAKGLREARAAGHTSYRTTHSARPVDPSRMSDHAIDMLALREAQRYVERSINLHNEQIDRQ